MIQQLIMMLKALVEDEEFFALQAKSTRLYYEALIQQGFTEEEAMSLVVANGGGVKVGN